MTKRDVFGLATKLVGLILLVYTIIALPVSINTLQLFLSGKYPGIEISKMTGFIWILAYLLEIVVAIILMCYADKIANALIKDDREIPLADAKGWQKPALEISARVVGIVLIANGIPDLMRIIGDSYFKFTQETGSGLSELAGAFMNYALRNNWSGIISTSTKIGLGFWLLFGSAGIARFVLHERTESLID
jgi:hypothetical protein